MPQLKDKKNETFTVRKTQINTSSDPRKWSPLGRRLMKIVAEIDASDDPPMSEADFERELEMRRTGYIMNGK